MIAAREVRVTVAADGLGWRRGRWRHAREPVEREHEQGRRQRLGRRWPGTREPRGMRGTRFAPEQPDAPGRLVQQPGAGVAEGAVQDQARAQLGLRVRPLVGQRDGAVDRPARQHRPRLDQDQLARDRHERRDVAHPVVVEGRERVEIGVRERAQRHGEHVELAGLDQREQQRERPVERRQGDEGRRLRPPPLPERHRRQGHRHHAASSASWNTRPYSGSRGSD